VVKASEREGRGTWGPSRRRPRPAPIVSAPLEGPRSPFRTFVTRGSALCELLRKFTGLARREKLTAGSDHLPRRAPQLLPRRRTRTVRSGSTGAAGVGQPFLGTWPLQRCHRAALRFSLYPFIRIKVGILVTNLFTYSFLNIYYYLLLISS